MILIDYRESDFMQKALGELGTVTPLVTGDYVFYAIQGYSIGLENKEWLGDLLSSLLSGSLADQCSRLAEEYEVPILLTRGPIYLTEYGNLERRYWRTRDGKRELAQIDTNYRYTDVLLALMSLWTTLGVIPVYVEDDRSAAQFILELYRWYQKPDEDHGKWIIDHRKRLPMISLEPTPARILRAVPGVGTEIAENLLKQFGTLKEVINADEKELRQVDKIGKKKAEQLYKAFNEVYVPMEKGGADEGKG